MMFGHIETLEERVEHLEHIRSYRTAPAASRPSSLDFPGSHRHGRCESGAVDYLKTWPYRACIWTMFPTCRRRSSRKANRWVRWPVLQGQRHGQHHDGKRGGHHGYNCNNENECGGGRRGFVPRKHNTLYQCLN